MNKPPEVKTAIRTVTVSTFLLWQRFFAVAACVGIFLLPQSMFGQFSLNDNFDDGNDTGWSRYAPLMPAPWNEQVIWSFPNEGSGKAYRIFGGAPDVPKDPNLGDTGPARVGSFRNDSTYSDFMA